MNSLNKITWSLLFIFQTLVIQAQSFDDDVQDVQDMPVDNWRIPMVILGVILIYFFIKKKRQSLV